MGEENLASLVEFIGRRFDQVDRRFGEMDRRFESIDQRFEGVEAKIEESRRHTGVLFEAVRDDIRQVAEGLAATNRRLDRFERKVEEEFSETRAAIRFSYA